MLFASQETHIYGINIIGNCRQQIYVDKSDLSISTSVHIYVLHNRGHVYQEYLLLNSNYTCYKCTLFWCSGVLCGGFYTTLVRMLVPLQHHSYCSSATSAHSHYCPSRLTMNSWSTRKVVHSVLHIQLLIQHGPNHLPCFLKTN